jgi:hypothetical protein
VALYYFSYNFIKIHHTLRTSPAMAAGVADRLRSVEDLVALWEAYEQRRAERAALTMNVLPLLIFIGSAGLLFGTSNMLPNADVAMRAPLRRLIMQAVVSLAVLAAALFIILMHRFDPNWAYGLA